MMPFLSHCRLNGDDTHILKQACFSRAQLQAEVVVKRQFSGGVCAFVLFCCCSEMFDHDERLPL